MKKSAVGRHETPQTSDAPDRMRNRGTAGAISSAVQCVVGGG